MLRNITSRLVVIDSIERASWNTELVAELLKHPARLLHRPLWKDWIQRRGGIQAVFGYLQSLPLSPEERNLLALILAEPQATAQVYSSKLYMGRSSYYRLRAKLLNNLVAYLNTWMLTQEEQRTGYPLGEQRTKSSELRTES